MSDSIVRIEYVAGNAALAYEEQEQDTLDYIAKLLHVNKNQVPKRAEELFTLWKHVVKKGKDIPITLTSEETITGNDKELLEQTAKILKTQVEHVQTTINRFLKELNIKR